MDAGANMPQDFATSSQMPTVVVSKNISTHVAVLLMIVATLFWATAGVISRQVVYASGVEITFWRSALSAFSIVCILSVWRGAPYWRQVCWRAPILWLSGVLWSIMLTAFMIAMSFTSVANVLIMMAFGPVLTALASRIFLQLRLPLHTWASIVVAVFGIVYMYATGLSLSQPRELLGVAIAALIPTAGSVQLLLMHREKQRQAQAGRDMLPAIIIGAVLSAICCLPFTVPFQASLPDMGWLSLLGLLQSAIPCMLLVIATRVLSAPEVSLLVLLETIFGILFAWWGASEVPGTEVWIGGGMVLGALAFNEILVLRKGI